MKWVTRNYVHLDRVACPWLITRFVDEGASFLFVPWDRQQEYPKDAIPFGITGVELGPHDAEGTTFDKILKKYSLVDTALEEIAKIIRGGVNYTLHQYRPPADDRYGQMAVGILAVSEGMMLRCATDDEILERSFPLYDALYANFKAHATLAERGLTPPKATPATGPGPKTEFLRGLLKGG